MCQPRQGGGLKTKRRFTGPPIDNAKRGLAVDPRGRHFQVADQLFQGRAALQPDVLADVYLAQIGGYERKDAPAEKAVLLDKGDRVTGAGERQRRAKARDTAADHRDLHGGLRIADWGLRWHPVMI